MEVLNEIKDFLGQINASNILNNEFDGILVKQLKKSNILSDENTGNQTHIAITGTDMDFFPYLKNYSYLEAENPDKEFKRKYVLKLDVKLLGNNLNYLKNLNLDNYDIIDSYFTSARSRRENAQQLELSYLNLDDEIFIEFRKLINPNDYIVFLKIKNEVVFYVFAIRSHDAEKLNIKNGMYMDKSTTRVQITCEETDINVENSYLNLYRKYYNKNIEYLKNLDSEKESLNTRIEFVNEYPIERLKELTINEYILGNNNTENLSYKLEYGKYKDTGAGIGGSTSKKWGIYREKKTGNIVNLDGKLDNPDEYWEIFKNELYSFLKESELTDKPIRAKNKYTTLKGLSMVLTKLLFLYFPNKFVNICSKQKLVLLMNFFGFNYSLNEEAEELSFRLNKLLRESIPELNDNDPEFIGASLWRFINDVILNKDFEDIDQSEEAIDKNYTKHNFLDEVYIDDYENLRSLLEFKKNLILEGSPGVGKTFMAKRLAYSILGRKSDDNILSVQFHQSYSYEEFIEGLKPTSNGSFQVENGVFKDFCLKAQKNSNESYYCIIDEINRGNISKILGELMMLIENDKRGEKYHLTLPYSKDEFYIPENLYIIGIMNTADRSLALIDYALRRRFSFYTIMPAFKNQKFKNYINNINSKELIDLISCIDNELNENIRQDESLGEGFLIGHSYFCNLDKFEDLHQKLFQIIKYDIKPMLKEYWFDDKETVINWVNRLNKIIGEKDE